MLSINAQEEIFQKYCGTPMRKSIQENFSFENLKNEINNKTCFSSVIYIDIFGFSNKIVNWTPLDVKNYLNKYYEQVMPIIKKFNGQIDKIMGDGIIVVFSKIFPDIGSDEEASYKSFACCKKVVETLYGTDFEAKSAIGDGKLFFCKTGVEQIYEEYTAIGHPMTIVYRLENIAENNQILLMCNTDLSKDIESLPTKYLQYWKQSKRSVCLKGVNSSNVHIVQKYI